MVYNASQIHIFYCDVSEVIFVSKGSHEGQEVTSHKEVHFEKSDN
jgi:hypothetical protein